jgi:chromosomal replication initiator protein
MYLAKKLTMRSYQEIGRRLNRHHTTIISGVERIEQRMQSDPELVAQVAELASFLEGR